MKPRFWTSLLIFLSAYAPLALIVAAKDFEFDKLSFAHKVGSLIGIGLGAASILVLCIVMRALPGQHPITITEVKGRAGDLINYSIPYLVTFVTVDKFFELSNLIAFALFMALMFVLTWKTQSLFINPILALLGYGLYDVQFQEGANAREGIFLVKGEFFPKAAVRIVKLSQFLYLATKETSSKDDHERR
jgi:hypothetical protein